MVSTKYQFCHSIHFGGSGDQTIQKAKKKKKVVFFCFVLHGHAYKPNPTNKSFKLWEQIMKNLKNKKKNNNKITWGHWAVSIELKDFLCFFFFFFYGFRERKVEWSDEPWKWCRKAGKRMFPDGSCGSSAYELLTLLLSARSREFYSLLFILFFYLFMF